MNERIEDHISKIIGKTISECYTGDGEPSTWIVFTDGSMIELWSVCDDPRAYYQDNKPAADKTAPIEFTPLVLHAPSLLPLVDDEPTPRKIPTTRREVLEAFPEPWRTQALANARLTINEVPLGDESYRTVLSGAFLWDDTPEGYDYWRVFAQTI